MKKIPVFYSEAMMVDKVQESPSPRKPREVMKEWQKKEFQIEIVPFEGVSIEQIKAVHDTAFVNGIMGGTIENGFGTTDEEVIVSLPYTSGSFLAASLEALKNQLVAVSPTSGFHHAEYNRAMGYCTFNGLMVSAYELLNQGLVQKIGILDCDYHYGNGTENIIQKLNLSDSIIHYTGRKSYPYKSEEFFKLLPQFLNSFDEQGIDILFYQAGADAHIDDPFGGFLSTEEMLKRDEMVFEFCHTHHIPVVWNLAGGYQEDEHGNIQKVLDLHNNTMKACQDVYLK